MTDPILILGKNGQVGSSLCAQLGPRALGIDSEDIDLLSENLIEQLDSLPRVSAVINTAGYTHVDKAELEKPIAWKLNAEVPGDLARWCTSKNLPFVHYSTDYVLDGSGSKPRDEHAPIAPLNEYGRSKAAGEQAVTQAGGKHLILRTSWVYDAYGKNFFTTMLRLFRERDEINVVNDQIGAPTYAPHLAAATLKALEQLNAGAPGGLYHLCNSGATSWHDFAEEILSLASGHISGIKCWKVHPIPSEAYPAPAKRPLNSRLDCSKAAKLLGVTLPSWEKGLKECMDEKYARAGMPASRA